MLILRNRQPLIKRLHTQCTRWSATAATGIKDQTPSIEVKRQIEDHWRPKLSEGQFNPAKPENKFYVLSMFPYPSGNLHMGHVRVYTISDTIARFYRMNGKNVFHPIGWDAFGLPAENAALERKVEPQVWTSENIQQMKEQLKQLGCSFDWEYELSTCNGDYYKWTQKLFLMLFKEGLVYQNEALVNWDPVDKTVLADEQVNADGCSWRSGAKVEKKLFRQWFVRTTAFAKRLLDGLDSPTLRDWRDVINLQRHWIGPCDGYAFHLITSATSYLRVWTQNPEHFKDPEAFVVLKNSHYLAPLPDVVPLSIENPFMGKVMPGVFSDEAPFPEHSDVYLAAPNFRPTDKELQLKCVESLNMVAAPPNSLSLPDVKKAREEVLEAALRLKIGGYMVSAKLQDWLISRQRYWGTPIPIVHCRRCGAVPVPEPQLPVQLPPKKLAGLEEKENCICPRCGGEHAHRETDTMDTFVDSSWYYLRYLSARYAQAMFDKNLVEKCMPVDLYIGGKEHAVLHLYYARFMNHFLHSQGLVPRAEPFSRLLVQGMVMGRSFRLKDSGRYVRPEDVKVLNEKKNQAVLKETKQPVVMSWEKMSKSKLNGVDPNEMLHQYGTDTTRLIILADVAPTSHRNWSSATFPGIINWQKRLWLTIHDFHDLRSAPETAKVDTDSEEFLAEEERLFDARNFYIKGATFNYRHTHQLSVAVSKMQGLTNSLRRTPKHVVRWGKQYERALASQIIMLAPMAPHFASELWTKFAAAPNRLNVDELQWERNVLEQRWPEIDMNYKVDLTIKINGVENSVVKIARSSIDKVTHNDAMDIAFSTPSVTSCLVDKKIRRTNFVLYPGIEAVLSIHAEGAKRQKESSSKDGKELVNK